MQLVVTSPLYIVDPHANAPPLVMEPETATNSPPIFAGKQGKQQVVLHAAVIEACPSLRANQGALPG